MNIKNAFLAHKNFEAIQLLQEYINFINLKMELVSGWKSFRQVYYEPAVFSLVEDSHLDLILLTRRFFNDRKIDNGFYDDDIIEFWNKDISTLFQARSGKNIWGYVLSQMSEIHFEAVLNLDTIVWVDKEVPKYLMEYFKLNEQDFQYFLNQYKIILQIDQILDKWLDNKNIGIKISLEGQVKSLVENNFPKYLDLWKQKSYWQKPKDMLDFVDSIKKDLYKEYKLEFISQNNDINMDKNLDLSKEEFRELVNQELQNILNFLSDQDNLNQQRKDLFVNQALLRLENKLGLSLAGKLSYYLWDYILRLDEISSELDLELNLEKYQAPFFDTANTGFNILIDQFYKENKIT